MADDKDRNPEPGEVKELLGYTVDDLGSLVTAIVELAKNDPASARMVAIDTIGALASSTKSLSSVLEATEPEDPTKLTENFELSKPEVAHKSLEGPIVSGDRIGKLKEDPKAEKDINEIRQLKERLFETKWGIETEGQLKTICDLIYGLTVDEYLDQAYDGIVALPDTEDFRPFQIIVREGRVICADGGDCPTSPSYRLLTLNLMAMATYFGGLRSATIKAVCKRSLSEMANSGFYNQGYRGSEVFINRGHRGDLTYELDPKWRAEGVLADSS